MKKRNFLVAGILFLTALFAFSSCEPQIGLGEIVDLEAPEVTITSPKPLSLQPKTINFEGTCHDNVKVTAVVITNRTTGELLCNAAISGDTWSGTVTLEEGEADILVTAKDKAENFSINSSKNITLLVDETAPEGLSWYVDRGDGVQVSLMTKEELQDVDTSLAENKQIPQNEKFTVYGRFYDAMSINSITLTLKENGSEIISKTVTASDYETSGEGKSIYAPSWTFTHDELVAANSSLASGKHYLELSYYSTDDHKNESTKTLAYLMWYPESDIPGIQQSQAVNDILSVDVGGSIPLHFFDDDSLSEIAYDFIKDSDFVSGGWNIDNVASKKASLTNYLPNVSKGDYPLQINVGETAGVFHLVTYAKDDHGKEKARIIKTTVADAFIPLLVVTSPQGNSIPTIKANTESKFDITGTATDTTGCKEIKIAYVPADGAYDTAEKRDERAKKLLDGEVPEANWENGEFVKIYTFPTEKPAKTDGKWVKENFSFELDVLTDFPSEKTASKFFEFRLEDTDGNKVYQQFTVAGDNNPPEIDVTSPENMVVCDYSNNDVTLRFKASKSSGLGIADKYKIECKVDDNHTETWTTFADDNGYKKVVVSKDDLKKWAEGTGGYKSNTQPVFTFYAEDVLGNTAFDQRTVVLSPLPVLEKVTADKSSGTYIKDTKLAFQAKFSDSVKVTGTPRLVLSGITPSTATYYAAYKSGSGSDTLTFEWTVTENLTSDKISVSGSGIDLNGGKIETGTAGSGNAAVSFTSGANFWDSSDDSVKREIKIDSVLPYITNISASVSDVTANADGKTYVNANKEIECTVTFSENVKISGNPKLLVKAGNSNTPNQFSFQSVNGTTVKFSHRVSQSSVNGEMSFDYASCLSTTDMELFTDDAGNKMKSASGTVNPNIVIDTEKPATPTVSGITNNTLYNTTPKFTISNTSSDVAKTEYSLNDGLTWNTYSGSETSITATGSHKVRARSTDKAGNVSDSSSPISITYNDTFPTVEEIVVSKGDGKYKAGVEIEFKVSLSDIVKSFANTAATLKFKDKNDNNERTVKVTASAADTKQLSFKYTVQETDEIKGIKITEVTLTNALKDKYGNTPSDTTSSKITTLLTGTACKRDNIILDGVRPTVTTCILGSTTGTYTSDGTSLV